ncbi:transposase [Rhizobium sp. YTU87027]|uniref:transposase n=1 Tax=Rhizobium sp. YTU87027 TaxID=3417741 RepID=UPI003D6952C7
MLSAALHLLRPASAFGQAAALQHRCQCRFTCGTIRLKLLKIGAQVRVSVRRIKVAMASACPYAAEFALAHARIRAAAR